MRLGTTGEIAGRKGREVAMERSFGEVRAE